MNATDPFEEADKLEALYEQGFCYDCGERNCGGLNPIDGSKDH